VRWDFLWVKIALETTESIGVRVIETSRRLAWSAGNEQRVYDPMLFPSVGTMRADQGQGQWTNDDQFRQVLPPYQWAECVQTLGGEGWELVAVVPVTADRRIAGLKESLPTAGEHDVQLWLFKRQRDEGTTEREHEEPGDADA
jgi:hypothetical protein